MMDSTVNTGMCRCCASEGAFKDIKTSYHWMGEEEVYSDMLRECFDIILNVSEQGDDGGICEVCITQLRNAINFKKQVLHTEEQFQKHLQNKTLFRPNIVKVELQGDEDSDDNLGSGDEGFSGAEFEVPIKTEMDDPKPKKRAAKASATTTRASAKKAKMDAGETSTKHEQEKVEAATAIVISSDDEDILMGSEKHRICKHFENLNLILKFSNATMIHKQTAKGYFCSYCSEPFMEPKDLKEHTLAQHQKEREVVYSNIRSATALLVKLDITDLKCIICNDNIDSLEDLIYHLTDKHNQNFHTDIKNQIFPFKFGTEQFKCCLCSNNAIFATFRSLHEHMHKHYRNYVCEKCDVGFINRASLKSHASTHKKGNFVCRHCPLVFDKQSKRSHHQIHVHKEDNEINKCDFCNQGFRNAIHKQAHLVAMHGVAPRKYDCKTCDRSFPTSSHLSAHVRRFHLQERRHKCSECDKRFFRTSDLKSHMLVHSGVKNYKCDVCSKSLATQSILNKHMRIHTNDRRFKCTVCGQAFVQKPSLNWHMKKHANSY